MSLNRLFIFDPESNKAVCIAKGYSSGWLAGSKPYLDEWFDSTPEYNPGVTRLQLRTETDLPDGVEITYEP